MRDVHVHSERSSLASLIKHVTSDWRLQVLTGWCYFFHKTTVRQYISYSASTDFRVDNYNVWLVCLVHDSWCLCDYSWPKSRDLYLKKTSELHKTVSTSKRRCQIDIISYSIQDAFLSGESGLQRLNDCNKCGAAHKLQLRSWAFFWGRINHLTFVNNNHWNLAILLL